MRTPGQQYPGVRMSASLPACKEPGMSDKPQFLRPTDDEARRLARSLLRSSRSVALGVVDPADDGGPFVSRALMGTDADGVPVILVSSLSTHTAALRSDPRCSLLCGNIGKGDPLAHARLTVQARAQAVVRDSDDHTRIRQRFLRRHPKAALYADFPDFAFFRLDPQRASLNGGFGRAYALPGADLTIASPAALDVAARADATIEHLLATLPNAANRYAGEPEATGWTICGIDAGGIDLVRGDTLKRVEFEQELQNVAELEPLLKELHG